MGGAKCFEELVVWQKAHQWVLTIYRISAGFPREELFGLTSQMRRAAASVPANIAEGFKRASTRDKLRFYNIAQASLEEARYHLILARDLGYGEVSTHLLAVHEISRMLESYIVTIRRSEVAGR